MGNNMTNGDVQFDEYRPPAGYSKVKDPTIVRFVIKYSGGLIKDEKQANYVILGMSCLFLIIAIIKFLSIFTGPSKPPVGYRGNIPDSQEYRNLPGNQEIR